MNLTLNSMDAANTWEAKNTRIKVDNGRILLSSVPEYGDLSQLFNRSAGHMLTALGVLFWAEYKENEDLLYLKRFFYHFLIARQLNDDAHDWWDDLSNGRLTVTVASMLTRWRRPGIDLKRDHELLSQLYWDKEVPKIAGLISYHASKGREALEAMSQLVDGEELMQWLRRLEHSAEQALRGRNEAHAFIRAFNG